jgi:hypothetical protein
MSFTKFPTSETNIKSLRDNLQKILMTGGKPELLKKEAFENWWGKAQECGLFRTSIGQLNPTQGNLGNCGLACYATTGYYRSHTFATSLDGGTAQQVKDLWHDYKSMLRNFELVGPMTSVYPKGSDQWTEHNFSALAVAPSNYHNLEHFAADKGNTKLPEKAIDELWKRFADTLDKGKISAVLFTDTISTERIEKGYGGCNTRTRDFVEWLIKNDVGVVQSSPIMVNANHRVPSSWGFSYIQTYLWIPPASMKYALRQPKLRKVFSKLPTVKEFVPAYDSVWKKDRSDLITKNPSIEEMELAIKLLSDVDKSL